MYIAGVHQLAEIAKHRHACVKCIAARIFDCNGVQRPLRVIIAARDDSAVAFRCGAGAERNAGGQDGVAGRFGLRSRFASSADRASPRGPRGRAFYAGKRLNLLVNFAVGGPTDIEGRLFAKYISRHIAGQPNILVQNMDGAGGVVGAKYLGEVAPKDGTYVGYFTGTGFIYALDPSRFRADFRTYGFVAIQGGTTIHFVRTDVPPGMKDATDIAKAQGIVGGGLSAQTSKDIRMRLGLDMLGVPHKYVTGYRSSPAARLAFQKGEVNMFSESPPSYRSIVVPDLIDTKLAIPVWYDAYFDGGEFHTPSYMSGLDILPFHELFRKIKGVLPSGNCGTIIWRSPRRTALCCAPSAFRPARRRPRSRR